MLAQIIGAPGARLAGPRTARAPACHGYTGPQKRMPERSYARLAKLGEWTPDAFWPDAIDETVIHDPNGRPWLVCTLDLSWPAHGDQVVYPDALQIELPMHDQYETQVFWTARAGVRGFPTGHSQRYWTREEAVRGHRAWCLRVRTGEVLPDLPVDEAA